MAPRIDILDALDLHRLPALAGEPESWASRYIVPIVAAGVGAFVNNADVEMRALVINGKVLPLVIGHGTAGNADVCSPYAHYIQYTTEEAIKRRVSVPARLTRLTMSPLAALLRAGRIDGVLFVNNWLFATNPSSGLTAVEIAALTDRLTAEWPEFAVVFRSLNPLADPVRIAALRENRYRLVRSRRVYMLEPTTGRHLRHKNVLMDRRLLERTPYEVIADRQVLEPHAARMAELYRDIYLNKHSLLNPQFNARFIAHTLESDIFTYRGLRRDGRIDGFVGSYVENGTMTGAILGYDRSLPRKLGLLRLLFAIMTAAAAEGQLLLNMSAGVGEFKMLRGGTPVEEFDAVFDRHLSARRRLACTGLRIAARLWSRGKAGARPGATAAR